MKIKTNSMGFVIGVAVILVLGSLIVPMRTSLGQGIDERVIENWVGVYDIDTGKNYFRVSFADGSYRETPMRPIDKSLFTHQLDHNTLATDNDLVSVIQAAYAADSQAVMTDLGTHNNAPGLLHPFSDEPVAYDLNLVQTMAKLNFNPKSVGGPDITPGSVPLTKLSDGPLQIDTKANGNTIAHCQPGQIPLQLAQLRKTH